MSDIKLDASFDILEVNGAAVFLDDPVDALQQRIAIFLSIFAGEYFADLSFGIPYHGRILVKNVNEADITNIFRVGIESIPGVASAGIELDTNDISTKRVLRVTGEVLTDQGDTITLNNLEVGSAT